MCSEQIVHQLDSCIVLSIQSSDKALQVSELFSQAKYVVWILHAGNMSEIKSFVLQPLVEYDESDSEEEEENSETQLSTTESDSIPSSSSSAGRPASSLSSHSSGDEQDDVSSTSDDHEPLSLTNTLEAGANKVRVLSRFHQADLFEHCF